MNNYVYATGILNIFFSSYIISNYFGINYIMIM